MSVQENKEVILRWFTEIVRGGTDAATLTAAAKETFAPRFVDHDGPDPEHGREAIL